MLGCESLSTTKLFHCSVFREVTYTQGFLCYRQFQCRWSSICHSCLSMFTDLVPVMLITICIAKRFFLSLLVLYNILLLINCYIDNNTTECHSGSMSDNSDLTEVFHQKISSLPKVIASVSRYFQSS